MPEWAEALFVLCGALLAVAAFRAGAAARRSPEGGDALPRLGRQVMVGGVAAGSTGAGMSAADGGLPSVGWVLLTVAAVALTSGFALRLGAGWGREPVSTGRRVARIVTTLAIAIAGTYLGNESVDAHEPARVDGGRVVGWWGHPD